MPRIIEIDAPSDYHVHLRRGRLLSAIGPYSGARCGRVLVMPNTDPPVVNAATMVAYREAVWATLGPVCRPLMTIKLLLETNPEDIEIAAAAGCTAVKIYPEGVTTNSQDGIGESILNSLRSGLDPGDEKQVRFHRNLAQIEGAGLVLCLHGEMPGVDVEDREREFVRLLRPLLELFPKLRVVMEHVTTAEAVMEVALLHGLFGGRIGATITPHHLLYRLDHLLGHGLRPHRYFQPIPKFLPDQRALILAAMSGHPAFFYGSDSAPHLRGDKEKDCGCPGVWNVLTGIETVVEIFEEEGHLDKLQRFLTTSGDYFYRQYRVGAPMILERKKWKVPDEVEGVVPMRAGEVIPWEIRG